MNHPRHIVEQRHRSLIDEHTHLDARFVLAWCIGATGARWPWLVDLDAQVDGPGCQCRNCAPDEQDGPLSADTARRLQDVTSRPPRCGGTRLDGGRCRALVPAHGRRCYWHRDPAPTHHSAREDA